MAIVGNTYLERGLPVRILIQWGPGGGPRNVLIRRKDGSEVVRPFRGLRRAPAEPDGLEPDDLDLETQAWDRLAEEGGL